MYGSHASKQKGIKSRLPFESVNKYDQLILSSSRASCKNSFTGFLQQ